MANSGCSRRQRLASVAKNFKRACGPNLEVAALHIGFVDRAILSTAELETLADQTWQGESLQGALAGTFLSPASAWGDY